MRYLEGRRKIIEDRETEIFEREQNKKKAAIKQAAATRVRFDLLIHPAIIIISLLRIVCKLEFGRVTSGGMVASLVSTTTSGQPQWIGFSTKMLMASPTTSTPSST